LTSPATAPRPGDLHAIVSRALCPRVTTCTSTAASARSSPRGHPAQITRILNGHPRWSAFWDKRYGLWRVAEDDPDLYAEAADADTVIRYITTND